MASREANDEKNVRVIISGARLADKEDAGKAVWKPESEAKQLVRDGRARYAGPDGEERTAAVVGSLTAPATPPTTQSTTSDSGKPTGKTKAASAPPKE